MLAKQKSDAVDEARSLTQTCDQLRRENAALLNEVNVRRPALLSFAYLAGCCETKQSRALVNPAGLACLLASLVSL